MAEGRYVAYVGTYTNGSSVGIHLFDVDPETWKMTERKVVPINNPSDIILSKSRKYLYSISDQGVQSFRILPDGDLEKMNEAWIGGLRGCYLDIDDKDRFLFVAGYHDGRVTMMRLNSDGTVGDIACGIFHKGQGDNITERSARPHVTCVKVSTDQKVLCAVDSSLDQVKNYKIDYKRGRIKLESILRCPLDSSPRSIRFDASGRFVYLICEKNNMVYVYNASDFSNAVEIFEPIQEVPTIEHDKYHRAAAAALEISPDGKRLFVTNAGINTVVVFDIDQETGMLTKSCYLLTSGNYPKNIGIMPDSEHFMVLSHETDEIFTYQMHYEDGYFLQSAKPIDIEQPNCIYLHKLDD